MRHRAFSGLIVLALASTALAQQPAWIGSWGASPLPPTAAVGAFPGTPEFANQTVRQIVRLSVGGSRLRLRLSNEYGTEPLTIGAARVALADGENRVRPRSERVVTFSGRGSAVIPAGAPLISDPIDLETEDLALLSVSLYVPEETGPCTCHATGLQTAFVSAPGDFTAGTFAAAATLQVRAFLSGIDVWTAADSVLVALGDSITDGVGSTAGANRRWPDQLAQRLLAAGRRVGIVNQGISGNRVLSDGAGQSALARFDRDVLSVPGVTHVIVFEGINDIGLAHGNLEGPLAALRSRMPNAMAVTTESMIAGYRQLIARAHAHGLTIYGATIAPYRGAGYFSATGEEIRRAVNAWILASGEFDAVLDFDAVLADPAVPEQITDGLHSGDFLHGSDRGYEAMAEAIDPALF